MPGKSDAEIIANFLVEKGFEKCGEVIFGEAVAAAVDCLGGAGLASASWAAYQEYKASAATRPEVDNHTH
jgi:hypothetical protein